MAFIVPFTILTLIYYLKNIKRVAVPIEFVFCCHETNFPKRVCQCFHILKLLVGRSWTEKKNQMQSPFFFLKEGRIRC